MPVNELLDANLDPEMPLQGAAKLSLGFGLALTIREVPLQHS